MASPLGPAANGNCAAGVLYRRGVDASDRRDSTHRRNIVLRRNLLILSPNQCGRRGARALHTSPFARDEALSDGSVTWLADVLKARYPAGDVMRSNPATTGRQGIAVRRVYEALFDTVIVVKARLAGDSVPISRGVQLNTVLTAY